MTKVGATARRATPDDVRALIDLCLEAREESAVNAQLMSPSRDSLGRQLLATLEIEDMRLMVADLDGAVVGFALARLLGPGLFSASGLLQVEGTYVSRDHRRRGAGHALMSALAHTARDDGALHVVTMPLTSARSEQRFLARLGFASAGPHRIAETSALLRKLEIDALPPDRRRSRGLENLIAARKRSRGSLAQPAAEPAVVAADVPAVADGAASNTMHVSLAVQMRRPA